MKVCTTCGTENGDTMQFCTKCGSALPLAPQPESWRTSGGLGSQTADPYSSQQATGGSSYQPQPPPMPYTPPQPAGGSQPMHPGIAALVSFFLPGIGLLFVPGKQGLGFGIFAGYIGLWVVLSILAVITFGIGSCLFFLVPLVNIAAAIHSYDEAAKASGGQFQPILFK
jgi:hypothetical protein